MREPRDGERRERAVSRIADRDQDIAKEARVPEAPHRAAGEALAKRRLVERGEFVERRRLKVRARDQGGFARALGELVPRTDRQAIVATEDAVADRRAKLRRDMPLMLDREIGDAP